MAANVPFKKTGERGSPVLETSAVIALVAVTVIASVSRAGAQLQVQLVDAAIEAGATSDDLTGAGLDELVGRLRNPVEQLPPQGH